MAKTDKPTLLVSGAGGNMGRFVVDKLLEGDAGHIVAGTRDPAKVADLAGRGAEVRLVDFDKPETLATAFAGIDRLLLISTDAVGRPGGRHAQHRAAIEAADKAGIAHVVYTSGIWPHPTAGESIANDHYWTEQAIAGSGLAGWTVLVNNIYADAILMGLPQAVASGQLFSAAGNGGRSYVTRDDCARVAAAALASDWTGKRVLHVTGPAPVTQDEVAALASELTGRKVSHIRVAPDALRKGMLAGGMPPAYAEGLTSMDVEAAQGFHAIVTPVVKEFTGREPTSVRDFLTANRAALLAAA